MKDVTAISPSTISSACVFSTPRISIRILTIARLTHQAMRLMGIPR